MIIAFLSLNILDILLITSFYSLVFIRYIINIIMLLYQRLEIKCRRTNLPWISKLQQLSEIRSFRSRTTPINPSI